MGHASHVIICGVPPVRSIGAGRLAIELDRQVQAEPDVRLIYAGNRSAVAAAVRGRQYLDALKAISLHSVRRLRQQWLRSDPTLLAAKAVVLLHPQSIGGQWCLDLIRRRRRATWIYLLDSSYFCIRSYNHVPGEYDACLRCVEGRWDQTINHQCRLYPAGHDCGAGFLESLRTESRMGRVRFMAQNQRQAEMAERHFGTPVPVVGMWTVDLAEVWQASGSPERRDNADRSGFDVVFHGGDHPAKGFQWAMDVVRRLPAVRFLFPMRWPRNGSPPENCSFAPMTWESGLEEAVRGAVLTLVPSLWSAPVEGAIVKSIVRGRGVVAPRIESGFVADLPPGLVLEVDCEPSAAARQLGEAVLAQWRPDSGVRADWCQRFYEDNSPLLANMRRVTATH